MLLSERARFSQLLIAISELYNKPLNNILLSLYWNALEGFDLTSIEKALQAHINHPDVGQYMPKPADIMRFLVGSGEGRALQAWSKVAKAMTQIGAYTSVVFDDSIIHIVITEMGGWISLCQSKNETLPFLTKEFEKRYMAYIDRAPIRYPNQLCGIIEHNQSLHNQSNNLPELIGDPAKALQVLQNGVAPSTNNIVRIFQ